METKLQIFLKIGQLKLRKPAYQIFQYPGLIGRDSHFFEICVSKKPVWNFGSTEIPDWL